MKIRIRYFLILLVGTVVVGYILGSIWPVGSIMYPLSEAPVDKGQNLENFISIFAAIFTLMAVIVALFKDEIVGNFKNVDISIDPLCNTVEEYLNEAQGDADPTVAKFYNQIVFKNNGNINALDCELLVEKVSFRKKSDVHSHPVNISKKKVMLGGSGADVYS